LIEQPLAEHVVATAFAALLAHQLGAPIPAFPVLIWAGAVASGDTLRLGQVFLVTTVAGTVGNLPWYWAGRRYGHRVLKLVCRGRPRPFSSAAAR
jgi:membrane protein DedA with SNARE-associated domain